jgi:CrcB protein
MTGGAIGTLLRYFTYEMTKGSGEFNLWGTITVNLVGSLVIGLLWGFFFSTEINVYVKSFLFIGILGGFTTFSTYALDILNIVNTANYKVMFLYLIGTNLLALLFVFGGFFLGKSIAA